MIDETNAQAPPDPHPMPPDCPTSASEATADAGEVALDQAIAALQAQGPAPGETEAACARVWERLEASSLAPRADVCLEVRAALAALLDGHLSPGRGELISDHTRECLSCRRALTEERTRRTQGPGEAVETRAGVTAPGRRRRSIAWMAAAAVLVPIVFAGVTALRQRIAEGTIVAGAPVATIVGLEGALLRPAGVMAGAVSGADALAVGDSVGAHQTVRTSKGSWALLRLEDGSEVEMNERSEVSIGPTGGPDDGVRVLLERGDVIVKAAARRSRSLLVTTDDLEIAVKGTIFTVGRGLKGSRVGVLEGSVQVDDRTGEPRLLEPGQQLASSGQLTEKGLRSQVEWSRSLAHYAEVLDELEAVERSLAREPFTHHPRHSSELLDAMPEGTVVYAAMPNGTGNLRRFVDLVTERLESSPELNRWWEQANARAEAELKPSFREILERLEGLSGSLGDEVVLAIVALPDGESGTFTPVPVLASQVKDERTLREVIERTINEGARREGWRFPGVMDGADLAQAAAAAPADGTVEDLTIAVVDGGHVLAGPSPRALAALAKHLAGTRSGFASTRFHQQIAEQYRQGTEILIAVDVETLVGKSLDSAQVQDGNLEGRIQAVGLRSLEHFLLTLTGDAPGNAVLTFREDRKGIASWLAPPAPMGSLDFISPEASVVAALVFKDPVAMLEDLESIAGNQHLAEALSDFRKETGLDLLHDVAEPLGGELAFALDGPLFPLPSWQVVVEVYDPERLQQTIARLIHRANEWIRESAASAAAVGAGGNQRASTVAASVELSQVETPEGTIFVVSHPNLPASLYHAFQDGYLVLASSRVLVETALRNQRTGSSIATSPRFRSLLPTDGDVDLSFLAFQDLGQALGGVVRSLDTLPATTRDRLGSIQSATSACLVHARASDRQITLSTGEGTNAAGARLAALLRQGVVKALEQAAATGLLEDGSSRGAGSGTADQPAPGRTPPADGPMENPAEGDKAIDSSGDPAEELRYDEAPAGGEAERPVAPRSRARTF